MIYFDNAPVQSWAATASVSCPGLPLFVQASSSSPLLFLLLLLPLPSTCSVRISDRHKSPVASSIHHTSLSRQNLSSLSVCKIFYLHIFLILILHCILRLVWATSVLPRRVRPVLLLQLLWVVGGERVVSRKESGSDDCVEQMAIKHTLITLQQSPPTFSLKFTIFLFYL